METVNTNGPPDEVLEAALGPRFGDGLPRVFIAIEGRSRPFPNDLGWHRLVRLAEQGGWVARSTIPLPDRGQVVIYTHPESDPTL